MFDKITPRKTFEVEDPISASEAQRYADQMISQAWSPWDEVRTDPDLTHILAAGAMALETAHNDDPDYPKAAEWLNINTPAGQIYRRAAAHYVEKHFNGDEHFTKDGFDAEGAPYSVPHREAGIAFLASDAILQRTAGRVLHTIDNPESPASLSSAELEAKSAALNNAAFKIELEHIATGSFSQLDADSQQSIYDSLTAPVENFRLRQAVSQQAIHLDDIERRHHASIVESYKDTDFVPVHHPLDPDAIDLAEAHFAGRAPEGALRYNQRHALDGFAEQNDRTMQEPDIRAAARFIQDTQHSTFDVSDAIQSMITDRYLQTEAAADWQFGDLPQQQQVQAEHVAKGRFHLVDDQTAAKIHVDMLTGTGASPLERLEIAVWNEGVSNELPSEIERKNENTISQAQYAANMAQQMSM